jgi:hypothetical protein
MPLPFLRGQRAKKLMQISLCIRIKSSEMGKGLKSHVRIVPNMAKQRDKRVVYYFVK